MCIFSTAAARTGGAAAARRDAGGRGLLYAKTTRQDRARARAGGRYSLRDDDLEFVPLRGSRRALSPCPALLYIINNEICSNMRPVPRPGLVSCSFRKSEASCHS